MIKNSKFLQLVTQLSKFIKFIKKMKCYFSNIIINLLIFRFGQQRTRYRSPSRREVKQLDSVKQSMRCRRKQKPIALKLLSNVCRKTNHHGQITLKFRFPYLNLEDEISQKTQDL